ncbi:sensor histidine kinase [Helicobacter saguini]|uniref:histidine kinase n=1 Tax=Helicobacter saguini TaxID=1548018 RepID=A0A4U8T7P4_9HELI|nr:HAMP domain-containing sensor histidine kinase [Helicobacter saguini]MWV67452.1 sensor histidine kinase [Helicobacter saguini]TLD95641.1 HAMP domain-containing histidine kinase [Helicobacter saguini]
MLISTLISCCLFIIAILFILFERDELAIVANTLGLVLTLIALSKKKNKSGKTWKLNTINSTKVALNALTRKNFDDINFKILEKENNPYTSELKALSEAMQKQQNRIQKRTKKLHEKNMQNVQLLSTISHEIKNPLSVIQASIETILIQPNLDSTMRDKLLNRILMYSKKINALLNKLTLSQSLEHSVIAVKMENFYLKNLCEEVIEGFKNYLLKSVYVDKRVILEGENREVFADRILIEQVLNNLIYNALKYAKSLVIVRIKPQYFEVIDDGNGVDKQELGLLTKKFYQGEGAKKNEHSLGLGLFIVKEIAKIHNTKVEFFSRQNKKEGLCVRFYV